MAQAIEERVGETPGKKALAMEAFAKVLRQLPSIVADNGGYNAAELITQLRAAHAKGLSSYGLDLYEGKVKCMKEMGVLESFRSKLVTLLLCLILCTFRIVHAN
jgi:T-complex protein 1 subunit beta